MGTWGTGAFDNDAASDWLLDLSRQTDLAYIEQTIDKTLADSHAADAEEAIAAAEVVARLQGNYGIRNASTRTADEWCTRVKLTPAVSLIDKSKLLIVRVQTEPSSLLSAHKQGKAYELWKQSLSDLANRLTT
jgi:Domain of unknown function (DUF4259)